MSESDNNSGANHRYLRLQEMARFKNVAFSPRRMVTGAYAGRHATPQRGHSVEFADYREYTPGDEVSDVDWKIYGRSDKLFIKLFEHYSDMSVTLLIDGSASMHYAGTAGVSKSSTSNKGGSWLSRAASSVTGRVKASGGRADTSGSKYDLACRMAAAIGFLTIKQQDKVALGIARNGLNDYLRPAGSISHLYKVLRLMESHRASDKADLATAIEELSHRNKRRGVICIFSDLEEPMDQVLRALSLLTYRGNEVVVFQILHEDELKLPDLADALFEDSETGQRVRLNVDDIRVAYEAQLRKRIDGWSAALRAKRIDHNVIPTSVPYYQALERYLFARSGGVS